jgi:hypothetical protein
VELPNLESTSGEATQNCLDIQADISFTHSLLLLRNNQVDMQVQATIFLNRYLHVCILGFVHVRTCSADNSSIGFFKLAMNAQAATDKILSTPGGASHHASAV